MSAPIGPGDWVECCPKFYVAQPPLGVTLIGSWPTPGRIYQVRECGFRTGTNDPAIRLVGIVASYPGHPDCWWPTRHFRPIYRPKADLIEQLKAPPKAAPVKEPEAA